MIKFEVLKDDDKVLTRTVEPKNGEPFAVTYQDVYMHTDTERFPVHVQLGLRPNNGQPYPVGTYTLAPESIKMNQYKALEIDRYNIKLISI